MATTLASPENNESLPPTNSGAKLTISVLTGVKITPSDLPGTPTRELKLELKDNITDMYPINFSASRHPLRYICVQMSSPFPSYD